MDGNQQASDNEPTWQFKPGETISPRTQPTSDPQPLPAETAQPDPTPAPPSAPAPEVAATPAPAEQPPAPEPAQPAPLVPPAPTEPLPDPQPVPQQVSTWQGDPNGAISWTASEYIAHSKGAGWHMLLLVGTVILAAAIWFVTRDVVSPIVILLAGGTLSLYGGRQPKQLQYQLDKHGISIGQRHFPFSDFRAFSVLEEDSAFDSIALIPSRRFMPLTTLYYDPADEDRILSIIGSFLPHQDRKLDAVDSFMKKIRF
jgi:hypothetical protein